MKKARKMALALPLALAALGGGCSESPTEPPADGRGDPIAGPLFQQQRPGTGIVLDALTGVTVPVIGLPLAEVVVDQAIITDLQVVEDIAGTIVGLEAEGILRLTGGVLGTDVVTEDFHTIVGVTSTGFGRCDIVSIDLGPIEVGVLDPLATVDVPAADVTVRGSGAIGSLLCNLGQLLGAPGRAVEGIVGAIDNLI